MLIAEDRCLKARPDPSCAALASAGVTSSRELACGAGARQGSELFGAPEDGLDCSGALRWLLVLSGFPDPGPLISDELGARYPTGPGREVTIFSNVDHVWIEIDGREWGTTSSNFAHGPGYGAQSIEGFAESHPPGL